MPDTKLREWARGQRWEIVKYDNLEIALEQAGESLIRQCAEIASYNETGVRNNTRPPSSVRAILREFGMEGK